MMNSCSFVVLLVGLVAFGAVDCCDNAESPVTCHGARVVRNVVEQMLTSKNSEGILKLVPGLEIITVKDNVSEFDARANDVNDDGVMGRVMRYLETHEVNIKLPELMKKSDFKEVLLNTFAGLEESRSVVEGRKKDKGGLGAVMLMGLMMGKMVAALGFGGVGALAMKALGVSMMALMLSALIGLKKLTENSGGESHQVHYVNAQSEHHRRRREATEDSLPYRGWPRA